MKKTITTNPVKSELGLKYVQCQKKTFIDRYFALIARELMLYVWINAALVRVRLRMLYGACAFSLHVHVHVYNGYGCGYNTT